MSIAGRISLFVLIYLGLVLVGFSVTLYGVTRWMLLAKVDRQLETGMHALVAAIEVHPGDVEWEPLERRLPLDTDSDLAGMRWTMRDERGTLIDSSTDPMTGRILVLPHDDPNWRLLAKRLKAGKFEPETVAPEQAVGPEESLPSNRSAVRESFLITVGVNQQPVFAALRSLVVSMTAISLVVWLIAGFLGRGVSRRLLRPLLGMADEARALRANPDAKGELNIPLTNDEVADLGRAYNDLLKSLRLALEQQRRFTGDASHQLRTPLAAMLAAVDVTLRHERSPQEYIHALTAVQRRGRDLQQIVEALLLLARLEPSVALAGRQQLDLIVWCQTRLEHWRDHRRFSDFQLELLAPDVKVETHSVLLAQAFDNLLDNACKYSEPGSPIVIRTQTAGNVARLAIVDRGTGLSASDLSRIFEPFYRAADATESGVPGSGLGLTIARRIANTLGGRLEADSSPGVGSTFCLVLPRAAGDPICETVTVDRIASDGRP